MPQCLHLLLHARRRDTGGGRLQHEADAGRGGTASSASPAAASPRWRSPSCSTWARTATSSPARSCSMGRDMRTMSEEELRQIRGSKIAMVYQEPMASLNPAMTCGEQLAEVPIYPRRRSAEKRRWSGRARCWRACGCPTRSASWAPIRTRFPAASSSAWSSPWRSCRTRSCCCSTSRPRRST